MGNVLSYGDESSPQRLPHFSTQAKLAPKRNGNAKNQSEREHTAQCPSRVPQSQLHTARIRIPSPRPWRAVPYNIGSNIPCIARTRHRTSLLLCMIYDPLRQTPARRATSGTARSDCTPSWRRPPGSIEKVQCVTRELRT